MVLNRYTTPEGVFTPCMEHARIIILNSPLQDACVDRLEVGEHASASGPRREHFSAQLQGRLSLQLMQSVDVIRLRFADEDRRGKKLVLDLRAVRRGMGLRLER
eukprot:3466750-Rhodomonas_salina.1